MAGWPGLCLLIVLYVLPVITSCPMSGCDCQINSDRESIIYCKYKGLDQIPVVTPSTEEFKLLTLSSNSITSIPANAFRGLHVKGIEIMENPLRTIAEEAFNGVEDTLEVLILHGEKTNSILQAPWTTLSNLTALKQLELSYFNIPSINNDLALAPFIDLQQLKITFSQLDYLHPTSLQPLNDSLTELDLSRNFFESLPVGAIRVLGLLRKLSMNSNRVKRIGLNAFETNTFLEELDLTQNNIDALEQGCFNGITSSLTFLGLQLNKIPGNQLGPLNDLTALEQLNLGYNPLANLVAGTFANLANLAYLNLQSTQLHTLTVGMLQGLGSSMVDMTLTENYLTQIDIGTFSSMSALTDLSLDFQKSNQFAQAIVPGIFRGLDSLMTLTLNKATGFGSLDNWEAITNLSALTNLNLAKTGISSIPDFIFSKMTHMQTLDLSSNSLSRIRQETFYGMRDSLSKLNLDHNLIASFDHCTFLNFTKLFPEVLKLNNNSLLCDCDLEWLSEWVQKRINESSLRDLNTIKSYIQWTCSDGRKFKDIKPEDLGCLPNATRPDCVDYYTTTTTTTTTTTPKPTTPEPTTPEPTTTTEKPTTTEPLVVLKFNITSSETYSIKLKWTISHPEVVDYFLVRFEDLSTGIREKTNNIYRTTTIYNLDKLKPSATYEICLFAYFVKLSQGSSSKCLAQTTAPLPSTGLASQGTMSPEQIGIIVGSAVGGVLLLIIIIVIIFILIKYRRQGNEHDKPREPSPWQKAGKPHEAYDSKRFTRMKKPGSEHHIKEIRHVQGDTNLQRTSAGSYQYLDRNITDGQPMAPVDSFQQQPRKASNGLDTTDLYHKYYEIALDGVETHI